jgi:thioredoxin 1
MKSPARVIIILLAGVAAASVIMLKASKPPVAATAVETAESDANAKLPKLLDLGATKCIPCKMMVPVLDGLKKEYAGRMKVEFIDVWQNEDAGRKFGVEMIPTQIFYDAAGKELFRHTGFFGKADILAKWKELGVSF